MNSWPLVYGWVMFAMFGGAIGFVIGWEAHCRARDKGRNCRRPE